MALEVVSQVEVMPGYRLLERLGKGGFGEVWKAEAPGGLLKAVKIIHGDLDGTLRDDSRLNQELKALQRVRTVRHPFILSLERIEVIDGQLIIVSELADRTLMDRFEECRTQGLPGIPREELLGYMEEAAEALDLMNVQFNLQHLDIKPQNLFLVFNHLKVGDFGLVKDLEGMFARVTSGVTAAYAAPETFEGVVSRFCDQYNLAIAYQELLTGRLPFDGTSGKQLMMQHMMVPPDLRPLPPDDHSVVGRALAKKPAERFSSCADFVQALRRARESGCPASDSGAVLSALPDTSAGDARERPTAATQCRFPMPAILDPADACPAGTLAPMPATRRPLVQAPRQETSPDRPPSGSTDRSVKFVPPPPPPELPETTGEGVLVPALIVGLGGLGRQVLEQFRKFLRKRGPADSWRHIRLLNVDTDPEAIDEATGDLEAVLSPHEILVTPFQRPSHYLKRPHERQELEQWLPLATLMRLPRGQVTAGGWRALGRLAFVSGAATIGARLRDELEACAAPEALAAAVRDTTLGLRSTRPRVYVVTGLTGGTGSGMFLDLAVALRRTLRQLGHSRAEVIGVLLVPAVGRGAPARAVANGVAALTELNYFATTAPGSGQGQRQAPTAQDLPFNRCVLLPLPPLTDGTASLEELSALAGDFLCRDLTTPLGRSADEGRRNGSLNAGRPVLTDPPQQLAARMTCQTFGAYWFSVPRQPLLEHAAQHICDRLARSWGIHDSTQSVSIEAWVAEQLARAGLTAEGLESCLQETCAAALGQTPSAYCDALVERWAKGGPGDLYRRPAAVADALRELEELLGPPQCEPSLGLPSPLVTALAEASRSLAKQAEGKLDEIALSALTEPQLRLSGKEGVAQDQLGAALGETARLAKGMSEKQWRLALEVHQQMPALLEGLREGSLFRWGAKTRAAAGLVELFGKYLAGRWESLLALAVARVFSDLQAKLHQHQRAVDCCRGQIGQFLKTFTDPIDPGSARADLGLGRYLLPASSLTLEEAVARILDNLPPNEEQTLQENVRNLISKTLQGHVHVCTAPPSLLRELREAIGREVEAVAEASLCRAHAAEMYMEQHAEDPAAAADLTGAFDEARPELAGLGRGLGREVCILAVPPGPEGERFRSLVRHALPEVPFLAAASKDDIVFYRERPDVVLTELPQLSPAAKEVYQQALTSEAFGPHSRSDIIAWLREVPRRSDQS